MWLDFICLDLSDFQLNSSRTPGLSGASAHCSPIYMILAGNLASSACHITQARITSRWGHPCRPLVLLVPP